MGWFENAVRTQLDQRRGRQRVLKTTHQQVPRVQGSKMTSSRLWRSVTRTLLSPSLASHKTPVSSKPAECARRTLTVLRPCRGSA